MARKGCKNLNRRSEGCESGSGAKVRYREKVVAGWQCQVCSQKYQQGEDYCLSCFQNLYYYCYINNQLFVTKDDAYLEIYYQQRPAIELSFSSDSSSENEGSEAEPADEINLDWVESLLL